jgi:chromosome segregation ATPase
VVSSSLAEAESTLAECASSLVRFDGRERSLGEKIARYRVLMGRREGIIRELELEGPASTNPPPHDDDDDDDLENAKFDDDARRDRLEALRARHSADDKGLRCVVELHKKIIAEMETMRRRMDDLVDKRDDIVEKLEECRDLLIEAADHDDAVRREDGS